MPNNVVLNVGKGVKKFGTGAVHKGAGVASSFKDFVVKGNIIDLAVGLVMGTAFTAIVNSMVNDILTPIIGLVTKSNLQESFYILKCPKANPDCRNDPLLTTRKLAQEAGAVTEDYGNFLQTTINFLIISVIMFTLVKAVATLHRAPPKPVAEKDCVFCVKAIPLEATRCCFCTSHLPVDDQNDMGVGEIEGKNYY